MSSRLRSITSNRFFNINMFRRGIVYLVFSLLLNVVLVAFSFYSWKNKPQEDFYASDGIRIDPIKLNPMSAPNNTPNYLLPPDPPEVVDERLKLMPQ